MNKILPVLLLAGLSACVTINKTIPPPVEPPVVIVPVPPVVEPPPAPPVVTPPVVVPPPVEPPPAPPVVVPPPVVVVPPAVEPPVEPPPAPLPLPAGLLQGSDIEPLRYFRLPRDSSNNQSFAFGGALIALDTTSQTLFTMNHGDYVAEVTIPTENAAFAEYIQGFVEISDGQISRLFGDLASSAGLLVTGNRLLSTASVYYDAMNTQRVSHFARSRGLFDSSKTTPLVSVGPPDHTGFVAGYLAHVPPAWQAALGGDTVTGQFGTPIVTRTSFGPSAFAFNLWPDGVTPTAVTATPLVYYTGDHQTLGRWDESNTVYGGTTTAGGLVLIDNTALFFGRNGLGKFCYGIGTSTLALDNTDDHEGGVFCYDPANSNKGQHGWPYRYQVWAYDLHDWAAVAAGTKQPWEVVPYAVWPMEFSTPADGEVTGIGGAAFDPVTRTLYLSQQRADVDGYSSRAYIHVYYVKESQ